MKTLNIELNVRRMEAQNIMTASAPIDQNVSGDGPDRAPERPVAGGAAAAGNAGAVPVRAGF